MDKGRGRTTPVISDGRLLLTAVQILTFIKAVAADPKGHGVQEQKHIADKSHDLNTAIKKAAGIIESLA
jgi:hypothetical protein